MYCLVLWTILLVDFMRLLPCHKSGSHHTLPRNKRTSSTVFQILPSISGEGYPYPLCTPNSTQGHPMPPKAESIGRGSQPDQPITRDHQLTRFFDPTRPFLNSCCKQTTFSIRRLGGPCATLGWPLGDPRATQGPSNPKPNPRLKDIGRGSQLQNAKTRPQPGQISRVAQPPSAVRFN
jgi:hypothetical protein